jgi:uncharacterized protein (TIGR03086 family)
MDSAASVSPAQRHRAAAARLSACVEGVTDWDAPTPLPDWAARDLVAHLVQWSRSLLASGGGVALGEVPDPVLEPVAAWRAHAADVQSLLDDPASAGLPFHDRFLGPMRLDGAVDRFYTPDVVMHTWDLARASGQDDRLDPAECAMILAAMEPFDSAMRATGQFGPRLPAPPGAGPQERLLAFIGRDPGWRA